MKASRLRWLLNCYPPYVGAGIRVGYIAQDYSEIQVSMKLRWYNRNYVNTHFGGSLYAMTDPFYMLMMINILGKEYLVWDKAADIEFVAPGSGTVLAQFQLTPEQIDDVIANTADGGKFLPKYPVDVIDEKDQLIARVTKTLYVRKK
jgi:hypothetical protein